MKGSGVLLAPSAMRDVSGAPVLPALRDVARVSRFIVGWLACPRARIEHGCRIPTRWRDADGRSGPNRVAQVVQGAVGQQTVPETLSEATALAALQLSHMHGSAIGVRVGHCSIHAELLRVVGAGDWRTDGARGAELSDGEGLQDCKTEGAAGA